MRQAFIMLAHYLRSIIAKTKQSLRSREMDRSFLFSYSSEIISQFQALSLVNCDAGVNESAAGISHIQKVNPFGDSSN